VKDFLAGPRQQFHAPLRGALHQLASISFAAGFLHIISFFLQQLPTVSHFAFAAESS
jgi:hypothetical protein